MTDLARPLRILHLASSQRWTGVAEPATNLAREQQAMGHQVAVACIGGTSFESELRARDLTFVGGFRFDRSFSPRLLREDIRRLRQHVRQEQIDIIHAHLPHDHWIAALAFRVPFVGGGPVPAIVRTVHREVAARRDLAHRWLVGKGSDMVIVVNSDLQRLLTERVGLPPSRVRLVRGAVDIERFHPGISPRSIRKIYKIPPEAHVAGLIARMQRHRGHHLFLDTLEKVIAHVPSAFFAVAGRGEIKAELVERVRKHPLNKHLQRIGYRKNDLPETYAAMDVTLLLVPGSDGTCRAMLEAMACGRPVIGSRTGAMIDTIEHGETGWLVNPGDRTALAEALIEALGNPERLREMGLKARAAVEARHTFRQQALATQDVYIEALERRAKVAS